MVGPTREMLKITNDQNAGRGAVLRLEGQVAGRWVNELRLACSDRGITAPLTLDLKNVTFIDAAGVAFFDEVWTDITVINCSLFVAVQLKDVMARTVPGR
jgi:anti-anti-sigma regulatory factor